MCDIAIKLKFGHSVDLMTDSETPMVVIMQLHHGKHLWQVIVVTQVKDKCY